MAIAAGLVISDRRGASGVIVHVAAKMLWVVPIGGTEGFPRHRSEVPIDSPDDAKACGIKVRYPVFRCHQAYRLPVENIAFCQVQGHAPQALLSRIMNALKVEVHRQDVEKRLQFARHGDERCVAMM